VITLIETSAMKKGDFIRIENYNLRLRPTGERKVTEEGSRWFNQTVENLGKEDAWYCRITFRVWMSTFFSYI